MRYAVQQKWKIILLCLTIVTVLVIGACIKIDETEQEETILAKIGDVDISLDEFMRRAEMTIRPVYCNGDNNIHKMIVLNSLIAEKMLALEAAENKDLDQDKTFQLYIQGRQEQAMREWLLHNEGFERVRIDDSEIQKVFDVAGRTYNIEYYSIANDSLAALAGELLANKTETFENLYNQIWPDENIPTQTVTWNSQDHPKIRDALYTDGITKNSVIGPLKIGANDHIVMKIVGWTDELVLSENARKDRWNQVKEKLTETEAFKIYDKYAAGIMVGKRLDFDADTFNKLVDLVGPFYLRSEEKRQELLSGALFNKDADNPEVNQLVDGVDQLQDKPLLRIEGEVWSVERFKEEIQKHPLVFRKNLPPETKFAEHYRLAIVDMIRDKYLTEEAYKRGYQDAVVVSRYTQMWRDALTAQNQKYHYLSSIPNHPDSVSTLVLLEKYMNPYITQLQKKYNDQILVNVEEFNKIRLTRTDLIVMQSNVPFQIMVPAFPQITTSTKLDYGQKMK